MTLIYLVRHGETDWNLARRIQGSTDIPLNDTGRLQAERTGRLLARRSWDGIASSPLSRAFETGTIIADAVGIDPSRIDLLDSLAERRYGEAEGLDDRELLRGHHNRGIPITNGSVHSFRHVDGALELVLFNDPLEVESVTDDCGDLDDQNAVEQREGGGNHPPETDP